MRTLRRGLVAGAFGTLMLNAATYVDMALTGRRASAAPGETVRRTADAVGLSPPEDDARLEAYGALGGMSVGLGIGVLASVVRSAGLRLPAPVGAVATGGLAMAVSDATIAAAGASDSREWSRTDWVRDAVPHLAYGAGVRWAMDVMDRRRVESEAAAPDYPRPPTSSRSGVLARSLALGVATGARSTLALGGPVISAVGGVPALMAAGLVAAELAADKTPGARSRLQFGPLAARLVGGTLGAVALARRHDSGSAITATAGLLGAAGASMGAVGGAVWRDSAAQRGWTARAAVAEDAVALALTFGACR
jgi:hypothetical protein